jgi:hypothetical protein
MELGSGAQCKESLCSIAKANTGWGIDSGNCEIGEQRGKAVQVQNYDEDYVQDIFFYVRALICTYRCLPSACHSPTASPKS